MSLTTDFVVNRYDFNSNMFNEFHNSHYATDLWPIVYILSDGRIKEAYVGETTDTNARLTTHLKHQDKKKLTVVHLITSEKFNKSATLDIESNLIKYLSGDGQYKLLNANLGLANHNYYQKKEVYWNMFTSLWNKLRSEGITKHSIEHINNSDLFKYSPYKSLTKEQKEGLLMIMKNLLNSNSKNMIIEGGAGTGKTILAVFLFKLLNSNNEDFNFQEFGEDEEEFFKLVSELKNKYPNPKMALVIPMSSFRNTIKKVFKNVKGLNQTMVIGPAELAKDKYDIVMIDESHRLRRRVNLGTYFNAFDNVCEKLGLNKDTCSEVDWVIKQSKKAIFFYDENQSIKPSDAKKEDFDKLKAETTTKIEYLRSQFRVKGGNNYVQFIDKLLHCKLEDQQNYNSNDYGFLLFDSMEDLVKEITTRNDEYGLSRLIAGYSWEWKSKKNPKVFDIIIGNTNLRWNKVTIDWVNSNGAVYEVGCIHTTQGYDLNYAGIIFGNEITYDKTKNEIVIIKENYKDKAGKQSINDPEKLKQYILNIYKTIMLRGIKGTYIYACNPALNEYLAEHITKFKIEKTISYLPSTKVIPFVNSIPVYDLKAAASDFSEPQNVSDYKWIELPKQHKASKDLFACTVVGESMNKIIPNGSLCLFKKDPGGSRNGKIVLVQHTSIQDESGSRYTVKEYHSKKNTDDNQWNHQYIVLKSLSTSKEFKDIVLKEIETIELKIVGEFIGVL